MDKLSSLSSLLPFSQCLKKFEVNQINIEYIRDDKISEHWRITDELKMMKDLGIIN